MWGPIALTLRLTEREVERITVAQTAARARASSLCGAALFDPTNLAISHPSVHACLTATMHAFGENAATIWMHLAQAASTGAGGGGQGGNGGGGSGGGSGSAGGGGEGSVTVDPRTPVRTGGAAGDAAGAATSLEVLTRSAGAVSRGAVEALSALRDVSVEWRSSIATPAGRSQ